jgi:hypothetical protein
MPNLKAIDQFEVNRHFGGFGVVLSILDSQLLHLLVFSGRNIAGNRVLGGL